MNYPRNVKPHEVEDVAKTGPHRNAHNNDNSSISSEHNQQLIFALLQSPDV